VRKKAVENLKNVILYEDVFTKIGSILDPKQEKL
jgi:hypothetical protein